MWQLSEPPNPSPYLPEVTWLHPPINVDPCSKLQGERGAGALVQPAKWRPEVSSCRLMTAKSSMFIPCIYLTTLTHFDLTYGVRIASYSRRLKCIRSNRIFERGGAAVFNPAKWLPEVSSCRLMTAKSSMFIPCIYLTTLIHFDWTSGVKIASYSRRLKCIRSNLIFEGGGAALFHPAKWRPEVSSCRLMTTKS
jgi:hypothetical protein